MTVELPPSLASGRFQIQERPVTAPGKCSVCGSVERSVIDFGLTIDYYGGVLICTECVESAYTLLLAVGKIEGKSGAEAGSLLSNQLYVDSSAINEYVRTATDSVNRLGILLDLIGSPLANAEELPEVTGSEPDGVPEPVSSDDGAPVESVNEPRPDDVPSDAGRIFDL